jgi:hypothetical protein
MHRVEILSAYSLLNYYPILSTARTLETLLCFCAKCKTACYKYLKEKTRTASSKQLSCNLSLLTLDWRLCGCVGCVGCVGWLIRWGPQKVRVRACLPNVPFVTKKSFAAEGGR